MSIEDMPVVWMRCNCYVWPIVMGSRFGRCGRCGVRPHTRHDNQDEPKARLLTEKERCTPVA